MKYIVFLMFVVVASCTTSEIKVNSKISGGRDVEIVNCRGSVDIVAAKIRTGRDIHIQGNGSVYLPEKIQAPRDVSIVQNKCF